MRKILVIAESVIAGFAIALGCLALTLAVVYLYHGEIAMGLGTIAAAGALFIGAYSLLEQATESCRIVGWR